MTSALAELYSRIRSEADTAAAAPLSRPAAELVAWHLYQAAETILNDLKGEPEHDPGRI